MSLFKSKKKVSDIISPNDKMLHLQEYEHYFFVSQSAIDCISDALRMSNKKEIHSILDFPCGHGRVLRSLCAYYPHAKITACDLEHDAVDFCVKTFGVKGVYSQTDPSKIPIDRKFDLIWCGSLLTHLRQNAAEQFFDFFVDHLEDDGVLVLSTHGRFALEAVDRDPRHEDNNLIKQYYYTDYAFEENVYLIDDGYSVPEYGGSFPKLSWVTSLFLKRADLRLIYLSERRWANHHDIIAIQKKDIMQ